MRAPLIAAVLLALAPLPALAQAPSLEDAARQTGFRGQVMVRCAANPPDEWSIGAREPGGKEQVSPRTLFYIGSVAKVFTSTVVLQLVSEGSLALDDTLGARLDGVPDDKRAITIEQLLSHTGGIVANYPDPARVLSKDEMVQWTLAQPLVDSPGASWSYSNPGYALLAAIVERIEKRPFTECVRARVFVPAGMASAAFLGEASVQQGICATGTGPMVERFNLTGNPADLPATWQRLGCGGVLCSAKDLMAFDRALSAGKLMPPELLKRAWTPVMNNYGLGWRIMTTPTGEVLYWSDGQFPGFNAEYFRDTTTDASFVVLSAAEDGARKMRGAVAAKAGGCGE
ncbi:MAG TPA: hypothetical protein DEB06_07770 [Phycisphaerales bacterium]|nr:hypothetical protein [Phycisphaerales bacterium]